MPMRQPCRRCLPDVWLVTDRRNDARLEAVLRRLPRGSGLIYRHFHLPPADRRARFAQLARVARGRGHIIALSGTARQARRWGADAAYGAPVTIAGGPPLLRLATAHSLREIGEARRARADAVLISPVFVTRSHPGAAPLGRLRFLRLAATSRMPAIALGGMNRSRARSLGGKKWAAIDGI